jgi:hypothetical protein
MTDVIVAVIGSVGAVLAASAAVVLPVWMRSHTRLLRGIKDQVANGHQTNLRDDLDSLRYEVRGGFASVNQRIDRIEGK